MRLKNNSVSKTIKKWICLWGPLKVSVRHRKINFPPKIDYKIGLHLETNMNKLFESIKPIASTASIPSTDAQIIVTKAPFIQYEQIILDKKFRQHLETIMDSKKTLRMGAQKNTHSKNIWNCHWTRIIKRWISRL